MILFLLAGLLHPVPATLDHDVYQWCIDNGVMGGGAYCCQDAGGYWQMGICYDSYETSPGYSPPRVTVTVTERPRP